MKNIIIIKNFKLLGKEFFNTAQTILGLFYVRFYLIVLIGINSLIWFFAYFINFNVSQDLLVLHYNTDFGVDFIGSVIKIYIIPALGLITILLNSVLIFVFYGRGQFRFVAYLLLSAALIVNLFLLMALASIYLINFR